MQTSRTRAPLIPHSTLAYPPNGPNPTHVPHTTYTPGRSCWTSREYTTRHVLCTRSSRPATFLKMAMYELTYFDGRGLGEVSRLIFAATGTQFKDTRLPIAFNAPGTPPTWPEFQALKATGVLPYGQVPTLVVDGGAPIAQSKAIERYLAHALGIAGSGLAAARLDSVCEAVADIKTKYNAAKENAEKKAAFMVEAAALLASIAAQREAAGIASVTYADIVLYHLLKHWVSDAGDAAALASAAPAGIHAAVALVAANAGVAAWEAGRAARKEIF